MLRLKSLRIINDLQREELAEKLGVSYGTIAAWEQGLKRPSLEHIIKACEIFNVPVHYLIGYDMDYDTKKYEYIKTLSILMDMVKEEYRNEILREFELERLKYQEEIARLKIEIAQNDKPYINR